MELIILLIKLIARAMNSGNEPAPASTREMDIARQIQQRIEEARLRAAREQAGLAQQNADGPLIARLPPPANRLQQQQQQRVNQQRANQKRKGKRTAPPPLPVQQPLPAQATKHLAESVPPVPPVKRPTAPPVDAKQIGRWLNPQTLRSQYVLTEIFQPPLSLREQHLF